MGKSAGAAGIIITNQGWGRLNVSTSGATINLNMGGLQSREFIPSADIAAPKTIQVTNTTNAFQFIFRFNIDGGFHALTWPANFKMADALWDAATNTWTPIDEGEFEALATYDGTWWYLKIVGLYE